MVKKQINALKNFLLNKLLKILENIFLKKIKNCIHKYMQFNIYFRTTPFNLVNLILQVFL